MLGLGHVLVGATWVEGVSLAAGLGGLTWATFSGSWIVDHSQKIDPILCEAA